MKNKKVLTWVVISTIILTWVWASFASSETNAEKTTNSVKEFTKNMWGKMFKGYEWKIWGKFKWDNNLTAEEKTSLKSMSNEEKKAFIESKITQQKANMDAKENVIDKILAWESLTTDEQTIKTEIIKQRADRKIKMQEQKAKMESIKAILEKKKAGETLTAEQEVSLKELKWSKWSFEWKGKKWGKWFFR